MEESGVHCAMCQVEVGGGPDALPLCDSCREVCRKRPLPPWVKLAAGVVGLAVLVSFATFGRALKAAIAFERGQRAEARGDFRAAEAEYRIVLDRFPGSTKALIRLAVAADRAEDLPATVEALKKLEGRSVDKDEHAAVDAVVADLDRKYGDTQKEGGQ